MDEQLKKIIEAQDLTSAGQPLEDTQVDIRFVGEDSNEIEIIKKCEQNPRRYTLKPLNQLYASPSEAPDGQIHLLSEDFMPILMRIEETIANSYSDFPDMTDGQVLIALEVLEMGLESGVRSNTIARRIQLDIQLILSLNPFTRDQVRRSLRKVRKSVQRHNKLGGLRGYLDFIYGYYG